MGPTPPLGRGPWRRPAGLCALTFFGVTDGGLVLVETAPAVTVEEVLARTSAEVWVPEDVSLLP